MDLWDESKKGKRVRLVFTDDPDTNLKPGDEGTLQFTDSRGTVHIKWDSGSNLGLLPGHDRWEEIAPDDPDGVAAERGQRPHYDNEGHEIR